MQTATRGPQARAPSGGERRSPRRFQLFDWVANPVVRWILRSPVHGALSGGVMLLTYQGRRSGRRYTLPVQYARDGDTLYVVPGRPEQKTWWRNLRGGAPVQVRLQGQVLAGTAEAISGGDDPEVVAAGLTTYRRRFPGAPRMQQVRALSDGPPDTAGPRVDLPRAVLVRIAVAAPAAARPARDGSAGTGLPGRVGASRAVVWLVKHVVSPLDRRLYGWTGGRGVSLGRPLGPRLLLTTTGRRTGKPHTTPVFYLRDGELLVICNVNPGFERPNPWTLNLLARPVARVQMGRHVGMYRARTATDDEIARYWPRLVGIWPAYQTHFDRSGQRTLFILERARGGSGSTPAVGMVERT